MAGDLLHVLHSLALKPEPQRFSERAKGLGVNLQPRFERDDAGTHLFQLLSRGTNF
jgi:hypothetical protein